MKLFFTWDEMMRDLVVLLVFLFLIYVSVNVTPITFASVFSGEAFIGIFSLLQGKVDLSAVPRTISSFQNVLSILGIIFLGGIFWTKIKINRVHHTEEKKYEPIHVEEVVAKGKMVQWQVILEHIDAESPAEWKMAILEADNMLDEILEDQGYTGETIAEKLKAMNPERLASYHDLWEAHKLRNQIAHGGAIDLNLSKKMARDTITRFENAFKELGYL
ncbi:hypothetical protein AUJ77_00080 [Candidatus Nomurabacteria bacterium CG1_02_43_90]|uniref:Uncharacterized protein n=1 Tax=Candidatus Nomurabacteria bacterium CG1_02_43_90 TaxID=1805281 RepID=A0A1J4V9W5_9BACT|nr:MAG: hypothetical protein AUJ77_00080 [Candidatus Nomurabacteria bacterium CG1_02_43_90]